MGSFLRLLFVFLFRAGSCCVWARRSKWGHLRPNGGA
eukprot:CAMPEP_0171983766 /NCGR_PEP_ID=MMETSP0993-20121228/273478_1 /TAXON_ID=483369 /ORGANISM="non described non described, Strain CCMP2098" /LENGTH=36 /DNA_ID= /DNA_START= /DNA_END= /DNA_ORIENTATION=